MKKIILIFLIKIFFFSQVPNSFAWDTTAAKFYPLAVGNSYTFVMQQLYGNFCMPMQILGVYKAKITHDTILSNGKKYFVFTGLLYSGSNWKYQRIDSSTMNVYSFHISTNQDRLLDSLKMQLNDTFKCARFGGSWGKLQYIDVVTAFGQSRIMRTIPARAMSPT